MLRITSAALGALILVVLLLLTVVAGPVAAAPPLRYTEPVTTAVVDGFRPPEHLYGPGNRGIEYATTPGVPVAAAADGEVVFAGPVAGALHVTVAHPDGVRTSYSFLAEVSVVRGQRIAGGQPVGVAGERLHVGARVGETYVDPAGLWAGAGGHVRLVPVPDPVTVGPGGDERRHLLAVVSTREDGDLSLSGGIEWARRRAGGMAARLRAVVHQVGELHPFTHLRRGVEGLARWWEDRRDCTPVIAPVPPPADRRVVVLVGGLGSTSTDAAIDGIDTQGLGYDPGDVLRFSYRGGRTPPAATGTAPELEGSTVTTYDPADTQLGVEVTAERLADLLADAARRLPGVPIDVLAHSQGGVVTRLALHHLAARRPPVPLGAVVTLASPHGGADLATVGQAVAGSLLQAAVELGRHAFGVAVDPWSTSVTELGETSVLNRRLAGRPAPEGYDLTTIGARGDLVVPAGRTRVEGAEAITVPVGGLRAHDRLPGSTEAAREIALALAGLPPSCEGFADVLVDLMVGETIGWTTDAVGLALALVAP
ncbi:hypothetical protein BH24ACT3_BH24ACT3_02800 [soil metagenome]